MVNQLNTSNITIENKTLVIKEEYIPIFERNLFIATFNVQIYGQSKSNNEPVMNVLSETINKYDIVAFQEIRDITGTAFPKLMEMIPEKEYVISERLGRSKSKEQYAYIYDPSFVTISRPMIYDDKNDNFEREPYLAEFFIEDFSFVAIQIHTKPEDAYNEIGHLEDVVDFAKEHYLSEDIIILGDLNSDGSYYDENKDTFLDNYNVLIGNEIDTTTSRTNATYDRIMSVLDYGDMIIYCGVDEYTDNVKLAQAVSDHKLIYCEVDI